MTAERLDLEERADVVEQVGGYSGFDAKVVDIDSSASGAFDGIGQQRRSLGYAVDGFVTSPAPGGHDFGRAEVGGVAHHA